MVGTTEFATDRNTARAVATTVAFAVEVPRTVTRAVETRGFLRYPVATPTEVHGSAPVIASDLHQKVK